MSTKNITTEQTKIQELEATIKRLEAELVSHKEGIDILEKELDLYKQEIDNKDIVKAGEERGLTFSCNGRDFKVKAFVYLSRDGLYRVKAAFEASPVFGSKKLDDAFEALQKDFNFGLSQIEFVAEDNKELALDALRNRVISKLTSLHTDSLKKPQTSKTFEYILSRFNEGVKAPVNKTETKTDTDKQ